MSQNKPKPKRLWAVTTEINGNEYESHHMIEAVSVKVMGEREVIADGIKITFGDPISSVEKMRATRARK